MKLFGILFLLITGCITPNPNPQPTPTPTPTPVVNLCNPDTQPAPHYGMKNGACLPSCGTLGGISASPDKVCSDQGQGYESAGQAYDVVYCCKGPQPTPAPTPRGCPCLNNWSVKPFITMDGARRPTDKPVAGGFIEYDSTPRFGSGNGHPCNSEHDSCGGRDCEDPRGAIWTITGAPWRPDGGYQAFVGPLASGATITATVCPKSDLQDGLGARVYTCGGGSGCGVSTITIP